MRGTRVVVTGGSGSVGRAIVEELGRRGAKVAFTFHRAEGVALELVDRVPGSHAVRLDLTRTDAIGPMVESMAETLGGVDSVVHAAGLASQVEPARFDAFADLDDAGWDRLFAVNVKGAAFVLRALVPKLAAAGGGNVVLVGALSGAKLVALPAAYAASKAALVGLGQSLAKELGPKHIRVNVIAPGMLEGGASSTAPEELRREYLKHVSLKRLGRFAEVAQAVAFFALDNTYVTGRTIPLDGGL